MYNTIFLESSLSRTLHFYQTQNLSTFPPNIFSRSPFSSYYPSPSLHSRYPNPSTRCPIHALPRPFRIYSFLFPASTLHVDACQDSIAPPSNPKVSMWGLHYLLPSSTDKSSRKQPSFCSRGQAWSLNQIDNPIKHPRLLHPVACTDHSTFTEDLAWMMKIERSYSSWRHSSKEGVRVGAVSSPLLPMTSSPHPRGTSTGDGGRLSVEDRNMFLS